MIFVDTFIGTFIGTGALIRKELINLLREPKSFFMIFFPIVLFLTVFVYATTRDVENASLVVFNQDNGTYSKDLLEDIVNTKIFREVIYVGNEKSVAKNIDVENAFIGITFPQNFSKEITKKEGAEIQIVLDGRRTNAAVITNGYISNIFNRFKAKISGPAVSNMPGLTIRTWYNPNKDPVWFSITNLICMIIISQAISLTSLSFAREKEEGTLDQLLVSPIKPLGILVGKVTPSIIISLFMGLCIMFLGNILYSVPIRGNILLMLFAIGMYVISVVGIGVIIAAFANTQQQAMLGTFILQMPMSSLSGIMSPTEGIPNYYLQLFTTCNPIVYANKLVKGIMLKNMSFQAAMENIYPLIVIAVVLLIVSTLVFAKKYRLNIF
ncbi:MAG: ABC transporter permease [Holosporales bacterium]|jgi:ABC-2 type transport system permease protein|nr:ABC transporter permease [Holosporales bacterium]